MTLASWREGPARAAILDFVAREAATDPHAGSILETAAQRDWTVVSMRDDWRRVFAQDGAA